MTTRERAWFATGSEIIKAYEHFVFEVPDAVLSERG
jgi:hypothetical protein